MKLFLKLLLEFTPLGIFFIVSTSYDIYVGSAVLVIATAAAMAIMWYKYRRIAMMALITAITGIVAGAMTAYLHDPVWVKLKPTIVSLMFAFILGGGLAMGRPLLKYLLDEDLHITERGWRLITWRWFWYFIGIAVLNEILWRSWTTEAWLTFKVFGLMPMTILYAILQIPLLMRHRVEGVTVSHGAFLDKVFSWFEDKKVVTGEAVNDAQSRAQSKLADKIGALTSPSSTPATPAIANDRARR